MRDKLIISHILLWLCVFFISAVNINDIWVELAKHRREVYRVNYNLHELWEHKHVYHSGLPDNKPNIDLRAREHLTWMREDLRTSDIHIFNE